MGDGQEYGRRVACVVGLLDQQAVSRWNEPLVDYAPALTGEGDDEAAARTNRSARSMVFATIERDST